MPNKLAKLLKVSPKFLILVTIYLDVLGIGLIIPILPHYVEVFNLPDIVVSGLFAVFSLFAFFSAPIMGMISDRKGRRPVLLTTLFTTALGWFIFAFSKSILGLFIGRIIDGLAAGNIATASNYLIDISENREKRTKHLGLIGAVSGIGIVSGPILGSLLFAINERLPFIVVGSMALISTILAFFFLPETNNKKKTDKVTLNPFTPIYRGFKHKKLAPLYWAWLLLTITISLNQTAFALYISFMFDWGVIIAGILVTLAGLIFAINQAFFLERFWFKYFKELWLLMWLLVPFAIGYFIMSLPWATAFVLGIVVTSFCYSTLRIIINNQLFDHEEESFHGEMMGVLSGLIALAMTIGPILAGPTYEILPALPFVLAGVVVMITLFLLKKTHSIENIELIENSQ